MTIYYITESVDDAGDGYMFVRDGYFTSEDAAKEHVDQLYTVETVPFDREEDPSWDWCDLEPAE